MTKFLDTQGLKYFYNQIKSKFAAASHSHNNMKGATSSAAGAAGLAPAPAAGAANRYLRSDGTWQIPPNTTYSAATQSANGLMTAADKKKLDGIAAGANAYTHPSSGVTAGTYRNVTVNAQGHVTGGSNPTITIAQGGTGATTAADALKALGINGAIIGLSVSGRTISYTKKDGTTGTITTQDTDVRYSTPRYNAGITCTVNTSGYTAAASGLLCGGSANARDAGTSYITVNGGKVTNLQNYGTEGVPLFIPVKQGDVIKTTSGSYGFILYPY